MRRTFATRKARDCTAHVSNAPNQGCDLTLCKHGGVLHNALHPRAEVKGVGGQPRNAEGGNAKSVRRRPHLTRNHLLLAVVRGLGEKVITLSFLPRLNNFMREVMWRPGRGRIGMRCNAAIRF